MFRNPTTDLIVVLVIVLLFFGPKRLPGLAKGLGQGIREFKDSIGSDSNDDDADRPELTRAPEAPVAPAPAPAPTQQAPAPPAAQPSVPTAPAPDTPAGTPESAEVGSAERSA